MSKHSHRHSRSRARDVVSLIFSFFFAVLLVIICALGALRVGALSKGGVLRAMDNQFYDYELNYINEQANYYTLPTGVDPSVLNGVFQKEELRLDMTALVETSFDGGEYVPVTANAKNRLMQNLATYFSSQKNVPTPEEQQKISESYSDAIMDLYTEIIALPGHDQVGKLSATAVRYGLIVLAVLVVVVGLMVFFIVRLHSHVHRALRYLAYATGGAGLMLVVIPLLVFISKPYVGLNLEPQSIHYLCVTIISNVLVTLMCAGGVLALLAVLIAAASERRRKQSLHRGHSH